MTKTRNRKQDQVVQVLLIIWAVGLFVLSARFLPHWRTGEIWSYAWGGAIGFGGWALDKFLS